MDDNHDILFSPLTRMFRKDGEQVKINIFRFDNDKWTVDIEDKYGNSTVYENEFDTDQEAFDYVIKEIEEQGIETFIGKPGFW